MSEKLRVGILGATGMVGQRFISLLENPPWFEIAELAHHGPETLLQSVSMLIFAFVYLSSINIYLTMIIFDTKGDYYKSRNLQNLLIGDYLTPKIKKNDII